MIGLPPPRIARSLACVVVVAQVFFAGSRARADQTRAVERYRAAEEAYAHGAYRAAAETFEAAYREDPRGASIYNAGVSWETAGEGARAADDYTAALAATDLRGEQRADATKRVSALEAKLGRLDASGPSGAKITVAHVDHGVVPAHIHLAAGAYTVHVEFADGHVETRDVLVPIAGVVALDLQPMSAPASQATPTETPAAPPSAPPGATDAHSGGGGGSPLRTIGWVGVGTAAAFVVAAAVLGEATLSARNTFDATGDTSQSDHNQAVNLRTWTNVAWVAAGVVGAAGVVCLLVPISSHGGVQTTAFVGASGVGIRGSF